MVYAAHTKVPISQSKSDIEKLVMKYGATSFVAGTSQKDGVMICFEAQNRRIMFRCSMPEDDQQQRSRWRAFLLCIKAKLESVDSGIETFEEAFLAHIVMPDGMTVSGHVRPRIQSAYKEGSMQPLLPPPNK